MDSVARDTFALPKETEQKKDSAGWNLSYLTDIPALPFFETIGVPGAPDPEAIQKFSDHLWPQGNPKICEIVEAYTRGVDELIISIIREILSSFGVGHHYSFSEFVGVLHMNYCNSPPHQKGGTLVHTDTNCIMVIYQDNNGGLKVKSKAGKWVDVKPVRNSFVVLTGDSFNTWSNGRIHNVTHRLICDVSHEQASPSAVENLASGINVRDSILQNAVSQTEPSKQDPVVQLDSQYSIVETAPSYASVGFVPQIISSHYPSYEPSLTSPHDASRQPSIVMQQTYDPSSSIYNPFLRPGSDGDARFPPFFGPTVVSKYNGNATFLSGPSVSASQETATSVGVASAALTTQGSQMVGIAPSTMSFPHQQMHLFPQPDGGKGYLSLR
ncbi:hypothetical protein KI387_020959 [Taxus chinensis]|uniref:Isopenicillin N synthase-like Fe(2+) 2OG dioxygenase domain-containing protein n=1 Tax=Taxus chinensis TaxID=29808 RepID=A0AA38LES8_TAXCH|nr:hypothetical protein KI387_020959 [Taxus chinensis]